LWELGARREVNPRKTIGGGKEGNLIRNSIMSIGKERNSVCETTEGGSNEEVGGRKGEKEERTHYKSRESCGATVHRIPLGRRKKGEPGIQEGEDELRGLRRGKDGLPMTWRGKGKNPRRLLGKKKKKKNVKPNTVNGARDTRPGSQTAERRCGKKTEKNCFNRGRRPPATGCYVQALGE